MKVFSLAFFFLNLALFVLFSALSLARYILFPGIWNRMLRHPVQSLYLGTFPMGATTLFAVAITVIHDNYGFGGRPFAYAIWALWWLDVAISILCCWGTMHIMSVISCRPWITGSQTPVKDHTLRTDSRVHEPHLAASCSDACRGSIHRGNHRTSSHPILAECRAPHGHFLSVYCHHRVGAYHDAPYRISHSHHCVRLCKGTWYSVNFLPVRARWARCLCHPSDRIGVQVDTPLDASKNRCGRVAVGTGYRGNDQCDMRRSRLRAVVLWDHVGDFGVSRAVVFVTTNTRPVQVDLLVHDFPKRTSVLPKGRWAAADGVTF